MSANDSLLVYSRFGLGARPGDLSSLGNDPKAALVAELSDPTTVFLADANLPSTVDAFTQVREFQKARQRQKQAAALAAGSKAPVDGVMAPQAAAPAPAAAGAAPAAMADAGTMDAMSGMAAGMNAAGPKPGKAVPQPDADKPVLPNPGSMLEAEIAARLDRALSVKIGFGERLVAFWANHFAVQAAADEVVRGLAGAFEREAIRPYVLGNFGDMVLAVTKHPAMLMSLNNATSIGPNSPEGQRNHKGLNENHARELMELHTVGVDAGYTQADVTAFAKVLTGWTFGRGEKQPGLYGQFTFRKNAHEPGPQTVMKKLYPQQGVDQGEAVIADLVKHPATARHIALLLARYFVADKPDKALVDRLAGVFIKTNGDLNALTIALINSPEAWSAPPQKLKTPQEFLWSAARALNLEVKPKFVSRTLADLGQPLWNPPSPQGFKDDAATWLAPDAITTRVDVAETMAAQSKLTQDPRTLVADILGPSVSEATTTAIDRAESRAQALALMLMSPEFQRR